MAMPLQSKSKSRGQKVLSASGQNYPVTPDGRYFVVRGRLWRCSNPKLPAAKLDELVKALMLARRTKDRAGVDTAKRALGERGPTWWGGKDYNRHLAKNTPYAEWFSLLNAKFTE